MIEPYLAALEKPDALGRAPADGAWRREFGLTLRNLLLNLLRRPHKVFGRSSPHYEGDDDVLRIENYFGRLEGLFASAVTTHANLDARGGCAMAQYRPGARA